MVKRYSLSFMVIAVLFWLNCGYVYGAVDLEDIVGLWLFDDDDPAVAIDSSGNGHEGQIKGAQLVDGKYGGALMFDGADDEVTVPHADDLTLSSFTIAAWFNCAGPNYQWQGIDGKDSWPIIN